MFHIRACFYVSKVYVLAFTAEFVKMYNTGTSAVDFCTIVSFGWFLKKTSEKIIREEGMGREFFCFFFFFFCCCFFLICPYTCHDLYDDLRQFLRRDVSLLHVTGPAILMLVLKIVESQLEI